MADLRTERWAEHRVEMRRQLVAAAMRAIEEIGPQVSMRQIAAEAHVPKPTLYRFFKDKAALAAAIGDQSTEDIVQELIKARQAPISTLGELVSLALNGYVALIDRHPAVFRFLIFGFDTGTQHALENSRAIADEVASLLKALIEGIGGSGGDYRMYAAMIVGLVTGGADSWMSGADQGRSIDSFVDRLEPAVRQLCQLAAADAGAVIDFDAEVDSSVTGLIAAMTSSR